MDNERYNQWIQASHSLGRIEPFMVPVLQGLARLDCQLIAGDLQFLNLTEEARASIDESIQLTERFTLSYLWVLGTYELVRTLDQRCNSDENLLGSDLTKSLRALKHKVERLRIPLAKMEPAKRHPTDSPIAYPAISHEHGIAWQVAADKFISRRELSDNLLILISDIKKYL